MNKELCAKLVIVLERYKQTPTILFPSCHVITDNINSPHRPLGYWPFFRVYRQNQGPFSIHSCWSVPSFYPFPRTHFKTNPYETWQTLEHANPEIETWNIIAEVLNWVFARCVRKIWRVEKLEFLQKPIWLSK